jgi:hypothetical protein
VSWLLIRLPLRVLPVHNGLERVLAAAIAANTGVAANGLVQGWLAAGPDAARQSLARRNGEPEPRT